MLDAFNMVTDGRLAGLGWEKAHDHFLREMTLVPASSQRSPKAKAECASTWRSYHRQYIKTAVLC